jgi:hypothetical protein
MLLKKDDSRYVLKFWVSQSTIHHPRTPLPLFKSLQDGRKTKQILQKHDHDINPNYCEFVALHPQTGTSAIPCPLDMLCS